MLFGSDRSNGSEGRKAGALEEANGGTLFIDCVADLPRDTPVAVHCQGGTRSAIAASLLQRQGFTDVANVTGGIEAWKAANLPIEHD